MKLNGSYSCQECGGFVSEGEWDQVNGYLEYVCPDPECNFPSRIKFGSAVK